MLQRIRGISLLNLMGGAILLVCTLLVPGDAKAQDDKMEEKYTAFGVAMGPGISGVLNITINRWTTPDQRAALINTLLESGQEKTVELLRDQEETGWVRTQGGRGMGGMTRATLHYAYQFENEGKRTVVLVTDRTMRFGEVSRSTRSSDYDISAIVMDFTKEGDEVKGQGVFYFAIQFKYDKEKNTLEVEHYGTDPIRLTNIKRDE